MTWTISPDSYNVAIVGSGLPECLVAASLVKSGKSVLIIDAVDTYGTDFSSFTPAALRDAISREQQTTITDQQPGQNATGEKPSAAPSPGLADEHEHSLPASCPLPAPLPPGFHMVPLCQRSLPIFGIRALSAPSGGDGGLPGIYKDRRGFILDLVPKVVYQAEALVDLLVRCRCHHYLEFKAVEGSFILQDGGLQPVPAGRADIFRDRRLGLADKRVLMRFIQGCMEARSGQGHLKDALSGSRPLAQVLRDEGLPPRLREVILYGIAMCDTDQEPAERTTAGGSSGGAAATAAVAAPRLPAGVTAAAAEAVSPAGTGDAGGALGTGEGQGEGLLSGADGGAALELFTSSQGRFGQEGTFMMPCYGSGSVAEAFVRLCAVHGAVTVLRQPVQALVVGRRPLPGWESAAPEASPEARAAAAGGTEGSGAETETKADGPTGHGNGHGEAEAEAEVSAGRSELAGGEAAAQAGAGGADTGGRASGKEGEGGEERVVGIVTAAGQMVRCGLVVAGVGTLSGLEGSVAAAPTPARDLVSRAVVVLDGPLVPAPATATASPMAATSSHPEPQQPSQRKAPPSLVALVVPPRCPGVGGRPGSQGADAGSNPHPVRALQQGASTCVCPGGRFLLYLSTPATSAQSYDDLRPTLDLLVDTSGLREAHERAPGPATRDTVAPANTEASASRSESAAAGAAAATSIEPAPAASGSAPNRPRALHAWFYRQPVLHHRGGTAVKTEAGLAAQPVVTALPGGVVAVPGPDGSLAGYDKVLRATEAVFRSAFPGAIWLAEADFNLPAAEGEGEEEGDHGQRAAGGLGDEEEEAIDELTAALSRLKDA